MVTPIWRNSPTIFITCHTPYQTDEKLDKIVDKEIFEATARIANDRHCLTEGNIISRDDPQRSW